MNVREVEHGGFTEFYITAHDRSGANCLAEAIHEVRDRGATVVSQDVFGISRDEGLAPIEQAAGGLSWPVTWVSDSGSNELCGTQLFAVRGVPIEPVLLEGRRVGTAFEYGGVRFCRLGGLRAPDTTLPPEEQARVTFERMHAALLAAGMEFSDTVRTWLYIDRILSWYVPFNKVRDEFFLTHGIASDRAPASTGVGAANSDGAALVANLVAARSAGAEVTIAAIPSPLQCGAPKYGSAFSRAMEIVTPSVRRLLISGTASIAPTGESAHHQDASAQIELTMRVARAILESRKMNWSHVTQAIAYFRNASHVSLFDDWRRRNQLLSMPVLAARCDICRDDLLFEIELEAVV